MEPQTSPSVQLLGTNTIRVWGLTPRERVGRIAAKADLPMTDGETRGPVLLVSSDYTFDPLWFAFMRERPDSVLTIEGQPVIAHLGAARDAAARAMEAGLLPSGTEVIRAEDHKDFYNAALRKMEWPFLVRLTPDAVPGIERRSYYGAYKGVTDILTKYLWPELALWLTRGAARVGLTPNMVTGIGAALCVLATWLFYKGAYWEGLAAGFVFMVLDTVDGKLARCTITSSKWGNVFDHGIDLVHPPFWWWAWALGLSVWGLAFSPAMFALVMAVIVGGYVAQRLIEGAFIKWFGMHIHVWRKADSDFRLITARRNPNVVILVAFLIFGRPDLGLIAVAVWTLLSLLFHLVRLLQAAALQRRGVMIRSWLG